jgi:ubiquinone/menaquinone biosynthesis C-methylase UbiE
MLPRVLEAEVMDTEAEARDYDAMDFAAVNRAFVEDFFRAWDVCSPVLDVCTGTARIPIELCRYFLESDAAVGGAIVRRWGEIRVTAVDLADHMLALARRNVDAAGLSDRISLVKADAKCLPFPDESFRAAICNGSVHHIPDPIACFAEMHRVCDPDSVIFIRDLLRPASEAELLQLVKTHAAEANDHQRAMFGASLRAALTLEEVREAVDRLGYAAETVQQTSDRHWTWAATRS